MDLDELADKLRAKWDEGTRNGKTPKVHLFGIRYADGLRRFGQSDFAAIAILAGRPANMATEIRKEVKLAPYVIVK